MKIIAGIGGAALKMLLVLAAFGFLLSLSECGGGAKRCPVDPVTKQAFCSSVGHHEQWSRAMRADEARMAREDLN